MNTHKQGVTTKDPGFTSKFNFRPDLAFCVGIEREFFIADSSGNIVPEAERILKRIRNPLENAGTYSYELSACQIESQSLPAATAGEARRQQEVLDKELRATARSLGLELLCLEVAPEDMPLAVYPDSKGRYEKIATSIPKKALLAACQVAGSHVHVGMPDKETALRIYNKVIGHCDELCQMGDKSSGKRLALYKVVAPQYQPMPYDSWDTFELYAKEHGFYKNPRDCWHMIRITIHGTIEFRNFGVTDSIDEIVEWAEYCRKLCLSYS